MPGVYIALGVNIDHVATVRQARRAVEPDPCSAAVLAELAGADQITVHLREDRRHIQDRDVEILRRTVRTRLNLEMGASEEILKIALALKPDRVTLVPEKRQELTTEGGLDVAAGLKNISSAAKRMREAGIGVSLFIDPNEAQIRASKKAGADAVELHTGKYADAKSAAETRRELAALAEAARLADELGLEVYAGHGLTYWNTADVCRIPEITELNIGHSIISRAVLVGIERAVREMKEILLRESSSRKRR
jgi:pyridoxine 5-phosphate synthase